MTVKNTGAVVLDASVNGTWPSIFSTGVNVFDGSWHHIAGVVSKPGGTTIVTIFIDGVAKGTNTTGLIQSIGPTTAAGNAAASLFGSAPLQRQRLPFLSN